MSVLESPLCEMVGVITTPTFCKRSISYIFCRFYLADIPHSEDLTRCSTNLQKGRMLHCQRKMGFYQSWIPFLLSKASFYLLELCKVSSFHIILPLVNLFYCRTLQKTLPTCPSTIIRVSSIFATLAFHILLKRKTTQLTNILHAFGSFPTHPASSTG